MEYSETTPPSCEIIKFLEESGCGEATIEKFKCAKVTTENFNFFAKQDFLDMYLPLGDVYVLMNKFGKKSRKDELSKLVQSVRKDRSKPEKERAKPSKVQVTFKWFNFDKKKGKYTMVRADNGGGVRQKAMNRNADLSAITDAAKNIFFPKNINAKDELLSHFNWKIADQNLQQIDSLQDENGEEQPFTIDTYCIVKSWKKIIFVLLTKRMSSQQFILSQKISNDSSDSDFEITPCTKQAKINLPPPNKPSTSLPGSSEIKLDQDIAFYHSLKADQEKEKNSIREQLETQTSDLKDSIRLLHQKEEKRWSHHQRLLPEPEDVDDHLLIFVLHTTLGKISRKFPTNTFVDAIYNWIGALCHDPLYFNLYLPMKTTALLKEEPIQNCRGAILRMREVEAPVIIDNKEDLNAVYRTVQRKRETVADNLVPLIKKIRIKRENVFDGLITAFSEDKELTDHRIEVVFEGESAEGDGVAREAFDLFLSELFIQNFDGREQFIPIISPEMTHEDYKLLGSIMYHFFLNYGIFPVKIAQASLSHIFENTVSSSSLLASFTSTISKRDEEVLLQTFHNVSFEHAKILDVLSKFGIRSNPSPQNVHELILKAAKTHLFTKPFFALNGIMQGFDSFFSELPYNSIESLYSESIPSPEKVLKQLDIPEPNDQMEENTFQFIVRFIEEADQSLLATFLRFSTGTSLILDGAKIKVTAMNMSEFQARPLAYTCFKKLILPKNFCSYLRFESNFKHCLECKDTWYMEDNLTTGNN